MSIAYKLFGIPKTLDEFVDKIGYRGYKQVNVVISAYDGVDGIVSPFNYCSFVSVEAGDIKLRLSERTNIRYSNLYHQAIGKTEVKKASFNEALGIAEKLSGLGLEATINGEPLDKARKKFFLYEDASDKMVEKLSFR